MSAMVMRSFGGPEVLERTEVARPVPGPGEVLIRVVTVAANRQDLYTFSGRANIRQLQLPHIAGNDPAGIVTATGPEVDPARLGERVVVKAVVACGTCRFCEAGQDAACERTEIIGVHRPGGFAQYVAVPAANAFVLPSALGFAEATALSQSAPVALHMLRDRAAITPQDVVLVTSAAGAIGAAAVQLAKLSGATVIAAAGGAERTEYVRGLEADHVLDYSADPTFAATVAELVPGGVSIYIESAGSPAIWSEALRTLGRRARVVVCGSHAGPIVEVNLNWLFRSRVAILGSSSSTAAGFREVLELAGAGRLRANIDSVQSFSEARDAFERIKRRENRGKVVMRVADPDELDGDAPDPLRGGDA